MASGPNTHGSLEKLLSDYQTRITLLERRLAVQGGGGSGGSSVQAGMIQPYAGSSAPAGWLLCDGTAVSRTTYVELFNAIGTTYGAGNGSTTFNLPDLRGRVPVGRDAAQTEFDVLGEAGGNKTHTHTEGDLAAAVGASNGDVGSISYQAGNVNPRGPATVAAYTATGMASTSASRSFNHHTRVYGTTAAGDSLQPYRVLNFIIATASGSGLQPTILSNQGTTAQRNAIFGIPSTTAQEAALANQAVTWFNSDNGYAESYYAASTVTAAATTRRLQAGFGSGWYAVGGAVPFARIERTTGQSLPNGAFTTIQFNLAPYDRWSMWTSASRLTVPISGMWRVDGYAGIAGSASGRFATNLYKNGGDTNSGSLVQAQNEAGAGVAAVYAAAAGQYFEIAAYQESGGALNTSASGYARPRLELNYIGPPI